MLQAQRHGLMSWMEEMDVFLHVEDPTKGDLPTLQAQLDESSVSYSHGPALSLAQWLEHWTCTGAACQGAGIFSAMLYPCYGYHIVRWGLIQDGT